MDIRTFRFYYDMYYDDLCRFLSLYTQDIGMIEDVVQEVYLKLWENRNNIEVVYIKPYLFRAAKNRILNHLRDEQNRHKLLEDWFYSQLDEKRGKDCFNMEAFAEKLEQAVGELPPQCQKVFLLSRREDLSYKQIADRLSISIKTVEAHMGLALKRIKDFLSSSVIGFILSFLFK